MQDQIIINNNLISYSRFGTGERAVLFLHGWRSQKEVWQHVINEMTKWSEFKIYAIDFPGFGGSPAPKKIFSVQDYTEVVNGLMEKLGLKKVILVGHSFGGRVGIRLAAKYPQLISRLVLVDAAGFVTRSFKKDFFRLLSKIIKPFFKFAFTASLRKGIYQFIGAEDYLATPLLQETFVNIVSEDLTEDMKQITVPTLIITGENDKDTPIDFGKKMSSLISNSQFIILPGSGHFSFLDKPMEFLKLLESFFK